MINKTLRTLLIWLGLILFWLIQFEVVGYEVYYETIGGYLYEYSYMNGLGIFIFILALAFTFTGCFIWTRLKNRHWIFTLWGILSPIGLLGISLLKDKSEVPYENL